MHRLILIICCLVIVYVCPAQPNLKPSIGIGGLPSNNSSICSITTYTGSFDASGYKKGDTIPDFTLYTTSGVAVNAKTLLQSHKPLLLVNGNYTCPVYRGKVTDINNIAAFYGGSLNVYIIYTVEAHPDIDISPYSGTVWVTSQNQSAGVLYRQPTTYGQRKAMVDTMKSYMTVTPQILIDGPCNEWWSHFGPAPNNAYLIDTNGIVRSKNAWFNKLPDNMWCSIDSLLGTSSGNCIAVPNNGNFAFNLEKDSTIIGPAGSHLSINGTIRNLSSTASVTVQIMKIQKNLPVRWETALCTDICLTSNVDTTWATIAPSDTQSFTFHFYTDTVQGTANTTVGFLNTVNSNNKMKQTFYATTYGTDINNLDKNQTIHVYPNPAIEVIFVDFNAAIEAQIDIADLQGRIMMNYPMKKWNFRNKLNISELNNGVYYLRITTSEGRINKKIVIAR
jgi:hypothetical protein